MSTLVDKNDLFLPLSCWTFHRPLSFRETRFKWFLLLGFFEDGEKKNCTNRLKAERRRENRRTLSYSVSLKDTLRMKKQVRMKKKKTKDGQPPLWPMSNILGGLFPLFSSLWKKLRQNQKMEESRVDVKKEKKSFKLFI